MADRSPATPTQKAAPLALRADHLLGGVWLFGVALFLVRLAIGVARGRGLVGQGLPIALDSEVRSITSDLGLRRAVRFVASDRVRVPMTYGVLRPVVLLPVGFADWSRERQRLVLLHELAHVARYDWLALMVAQAALAMYWFHPLAWYGLSRLRREAEEAADDRVLEAGARASAYARHLLDIVRSLGVPSPLPVAAVSMLGSRFERRVRAILDPDRLRRGLSRSAALAAAVLLASGVTMLAALEVEAADAGSDLRPVLAMPPMPPMPPMLASPALAPMPPLPTLVPSPSIPFAVLADNRREARARARRDRQEARTSAELAELDGCDDCSAYSRALELHHEKHYAEAIALFEKAVEARERRGAATYNIACGYARLGQTDRAIEALEQAIERGFDVEDYLLSDDDLASLRGDARFQKLVSENGGDNIRLRAVRQLESLQRDPDSDASDWYSVAMNLHRMGEYDRAIEAWQKTIAADPSSATATYNIACARARKGDKDGALTTLALAIERGYSGVEHMQEDDDLESLRSEPRFQELVTMARALELPDINGDREHQEFYRPAWRAAVTRYGEWVKTHPRSGRGWFNFGFAALAAGDPDTAVTGFQRAFEFDYRKPVSAYDLACAYARKGDRDRAFEWLDKAFELGFDNGWQIYADPDLESLHEDARFETLAQRFHQDQNSFGVGWKKSWKKLWRHFRNHSDE